jgi:hypothetical protein
MVRPICSGVDNAGRRQRHEQPDKYQIGGRKKWLLSETEQKNGNQQNDQKCARQKAVSGAIEDSIAHRQHGVVGDKDRECHTENEFPELVA